MQQQFRHWASLLEDAFLLVTVDGRIVEANAAAASLAQRSHSDLIRLSLHDLVVDQPEGLQGYLRLCARNKQFMPGRATLQVMGRTVACRCDGARGTIDPQAEPLLIFRLREKQIAQAGFQLLNQEQQIERLAHEIEQRKRAMASLYIERERFRVTLSSIGDGVIATDALGQVTFMNATAEILTGWTLDTSAGTPLTDVFRIVNEQTGIPVVNPLQQALREGVVVGLANHTVLIDRHGGRRAIDDSAAPIRAENGEILGAVLVFRDVSTKRAGEIALEQSHVALEARVAERTLAIERTNRDLLTNQGKLEAANTELAQFAYIAAHDLQEPLRMIVSYLQLVERRSHSVLDEKSRVYFSVVSTSARRMQEMVKSVLDYCTLGGNDHVLIAVDLTVAVREAVDNLRNRLELDGAQVDYAMLPTVLGDHPSIVRLFQNLIANAVKFRSAKAPHIRINASPSNGRWKITVTDNGIGIRPDEGVRLFQLFQRVHSSEQYSGVGIGLASCKKIVEQHGGSIHFEAVTGGGTAFIFTLTMVA